MNFIKELTKTKENSIFNTCLFLLKNLNLNFTKIGLSTSLEDHLDYPSFLSIKDSLAKYGIESAAIRKGKYQYSQFETPFICSIQKENWSTPNYTIVTSISEKTIEYLDPISNKIIKAATTYFEKIDKNIVLLLDVSLAKDEINFTENKKKQNVNSIIKKLPFYLIGFAIVLSIGNILSKSLETQYWCTIGYILTSSFGLIISALLVWYDIDSQNTFIKEVCGGGAGTNISCQAVLSSPKASIFGISWSTGGFAFFATFLMTLILFSSDLTFCSVWSYISLLVCFYVLFSVYYQWKVIKQWCSLCLCIQAILVINTVIAITYITSIHFSLTSIPIYSITTVLFIGFIFLSLTHTAIPILKRASDSMSYKKKWEKLRFTPEIFKALLDKSDSVNVPADNLGIIIGNPNAKNEIIKVCNPYCGPCSKMHPELHKIIQSNANIRIRMIFTASGEESDIRTPPVAHFLSIQEKLGSSELDRALNDWYLGQNKDFEAFVKKYPIVQDLNQHTVKIKAMSDWCDNMKIRVTPTIFVNGKELPDNYKVSDLKEFF